MLLNVRGQIILQVWHSLQISFALTALHGIPSLTHRSQACPTPESKKIFNENFNNSLAPPSITRPLRRV